MPDPVFKTSTGMFIHTMLYVPLLFTTHFHATIAGCHSYRIGSDYNKNEIIVTQEKFI